MRQASGALLVLAAQFGHGVAAYDSCPNDFFGTNSKTIVFAGDATPGEAHKMAACIARQ